MYRGYARLVHRERAIPRETMSELPTRDLPARRNLRAGLALAALLGCALVCSPVRAQRGAKAPRSNSPADAIPFLPAPKGQIPTRPRPERALVASQASHSRRYAITLAPTVASLRLAMAGRDSRHFGAGWSLDGELGLTPWLWLQLGWQRLYYLAYAHARLADQSNRAESLAAGGWIRWQDLSAGLRYAIDDGHIRPIIEGGAGWASLQSPVGVSAGQAGQSCDAQSPCDPGLACVEGGCRPQGGISAYVGAGAQWLLGRYFSTGISARYFMYPDSGGRLASPAQWTLSLRASLRY